MKTVSSPTPLLHEAQAAKLLGVSIAWMQRKRWEGDGPAYIKYSRAVRYEPAAIDAWIDRHRVAPGPERLDESRDRLSGSV